MLHEFIALDRDETVRGSERLGFLAHELRNLIHSAIMPLRGPAIANL
jgi:hypothetical protein